MSQYRIVREVDNDLIVRWNGLLALKKGVDDAPKDGVIDSFEIEIYPGDEDLVVEFKLSNGNKESGPWLDVILWNEGQEAHVLDPSHEEIDGEFRLRDSFSNKEYTVVLVAKKL